MATVRGVLLSALPFIDRWNDNRGARNRPLAVTVTCLVVLAVLFGASLSFLTPIGYQTNLMVYGPGGYTFRDFLRVGSPLTLMYTILCIAFISYFYNLV